MNIQEVPFNRYLRIRPSSKPGYILELEHDKKLSNHLGSLHAGALFSLAEAASGAFLLRQFHHIELEFVPVVRRADIKYSRPADGMVYAIADFAEQSADEVYSGLTESGKVAVKIKVELFNEHNDRTAWATIQWFIALVQ